MSYQQFWHRLAQIYDEGEAKAIARMVYEVRYGLSLSDLLMGRDDKVPQDELQEIVYRLEQQEPVQYVLGQAEFCGHSFLVNHNVLIPRPETEELCHWILKSIDSTSSTAPIEILDIGTGSGCIAVTLASEIPEAKVTAWDISAEALQVAEENARRNYVNVIFEQVDILKAPNTHHLDIIVSNPPYICHQEQTAMEQNVLDYEPHAALFVPDEDPLLFYRTIANYAQIALKEEGTLYFEINPLYADALQTMLCSMRFSLIEIKKDSFGKQRMIKAQR